MKPITIDMMKSFGSMSEKMATVLKIAGASRMNVIISGGTGSGKTTMLNALSKMIDPGERVITIEDAAELRLQQPHWLPLETRPANLEGQGAIESAWGISETNRRARYYQLTAPGRRLLRAKAKVWEQYAGAVSAVLQSAER